MITENLSTLKIHKLTQAQYDRELAKGNIDETALYLTPDEDVYTKAEMDEKISKINTSIEEVETVVEGKADTIHTHDASDITSVLPLDVLPLDALNIPKIVTGVATGSSIASESNPNQITFSFKPKLVIVTNDIRYVDSGSSPPMCGDWFFWVDGVTEDRVGVVSAQYGDYDFRHYSLNENNDNTFTFSWWVDQGKTSSTTYHCAVVGPYIALG